MSKSISFLSSLSSLPRRTVLCWCGAAYVLCRSVTVFIQERERDRRVVEIIAAYRDLRAQSQPRQLPPSLSFPPSSSSHSALPSSPLHYDDAGPSEHAPAAVSSAVWNELEIRSDGSEEEEVLSVVHVIKTLRVVLYVLFRDIIFHAFILYFLSAEVSAVHCEGEPIFGHLFHRIGEWAHVTRRLSISSFFLKLSLFWNSLWLGTTAASLFLQRTYYLLCVVCGQLGEYRQLREYVRKYTDLKYGERRERISMRLRDVLRRMFAVEWRNSIIYMREREIFYFILMAESDRLSTIYDVNVLPLGSIASMMNSHQIICELIYKSNMHPIVRTVHGINLLLICKTLIVFSSHPFHSFLHSLSHIRWLHSQLSKKLCECFSQFPINFCGLLLREWHKHVYEPSTRTELSYPLLIPFSLHFFSLRLLLD